VCVCACVCSVLYPCQKVKENPFAVHLGDNQPPTSLLPIFEEIIKYLDFSLIIHLLTCAYIVWVISPPVTYPQLLPPSNLCTVSHSEPCHLALLKCD
jgi:hypothetical protein